MKVKLGPLEPGSIPSARGAFYIRDTRWGPVAQKWPKPRPKPRNENEANFRKRFGFAARMAATPYTLDYQTAVEMAKGTEQVPRDILVMAALGRYYEIQMPDGTFWQPATGPLAYTRAERGNTMWEWSLADSAWNTGYNNNNFATKGTIFDPPFNDNIYGVRTVLPAVLNATYKVVHAVLNASNVIQSVTSSGSVLATRAGQQVMEFPFEFQLSANVRNYLALVRTDATATTNLQWLYAANQAWHIPLLHRGYGWLASVNPAVGNTIANTGANFCPPFGLLYMQ